ncbi:MAG: hypothetical protein HY791_20935 [Deltaproteobacteria bacterium]|nr:hypothetical protein [Deltaproteobacteria bacterium]
MSLYTGTLAGGRYGGYHFGAVKTRNLGYGLDAKITSSSEFDPAEANSSLTPELGELDIGARRFPTPRDPTGDFHERPPARSSRGPVA